ncbi:MAG: hypothetical protein QOF97_2671, partial [Acidimicrobiaceae bacterium]
MSRVANHVAASTGLNAARGVLDLTAGSTAP